MEPAPCRLHRSSLPFFFALSLPFRFQKSTSHRLNKCGIRILEPRISSTNLIYQFPSVVYLQCTCVAVACAIGKQPVRRQGVVVVFLEGERAVCEAFRSVWRFSSSYFCPPRYGRKLRSRARPATRRAPSCPASPSRRRVRRSSRNPAPPSPTARASTASSIYRLAPIQ